MNWLAVDIGGANIKISDGKTFADSTAFPLWKDPTGLAQELRKLLAEAPVSERLAVTMTGELADCFENKAAGVNAILDAVEEAAASRHTRCYLVDGRVVTLQVAPSSNQPPTIITWGRHDEIFPASGALPYLRDLPNAELHLLDTGHFALEEDGQRIAGLIRNFLGDLPR